MADTTDQGYDTSIGTGDRSTVAATKVWAIVLGIVFIIGAILITVFLTRSSTSSSGGPNSENTATRPAEP